MSDVELCDHDPAWREQFERERERILATAGDGLCGCFHVGSTAVPGLVAKPTVDVLAVYESEAAVATARDALRASYDVHRDDPDWVGLTRSADGCAVFVHLRPRSADAWRDQIVFRELLRDDPTARAAYEAAKREAAAAHADDVSAYTDAKAPTVRRLTERAYDAGYDDGLPAFEDCR